MGEKYQKSDYEIGSQQAGKSIIQAGGNIINAGRDVILPPDLPATAKSEVNNAKNEIERIKRLALGTYSTSEKIKAIDTLAAYSVSAIEAIIEIADKTYSSTIRNHALDTVHNIKKAENLKQ
jgi:hypothetical protein